MKALPLGEARAWFARLNSPNGRGTSGCASLYSSGIREDKDASEVGPGKGLVIMAAKATLEVASAKRWMCRISERCSIPEPDSPEVAEKMTTSGSPKSFLPHLKGRPISLKRYPDGVDGFLFYEKECPSH